MDHGDKVGIWVVLLFVLVSELPCILRTVAIQVRNDDVWPVVIGTIGGNILALVLGLLLARLITSLLTPGQMELVHTASGLSLIAMGIYLLATHHH